MSLSILYIHHSGVFGGASRSLLELIRAFPDAEVKAHLITQRGKVAKVFRKHDIDVIETLGISQFDHTRFGYYRGVRWLLQARELLYLPFTMIAILKARRQWPDIDLVHINEITNVVAILFVALIFKAPLIVHVRSVQQMQHGTLRRRFVSWLLNKANACIAIDSTVRQSLRQDIPVEIIHNGFRLTGEKTVPKAYEENSFKQQPMRIYFVGGLLLMKGILEFVKAAKLCADGGLNVKFIVVGETPRKQQGIKSKLLNALGFSFDVNGWCRDYIAEYGLDEMIEFRGFTLDIEAVYREMDILCFPSHLNAVGRPVIEAALAGVPSIVAMAEGAEDTIRHQQTGLLIRQKDATDLFSAVQYFYEHPTEINRMGSEALKLSEQNFNINRNAQRVLGIYEKAIVKANGQ